MPIDIHAKCYFCIKICRVAFFFLFRTNPTIREVAMVLTTPATSLWYLEISLFHIKGVQALGYACKSPKWHLCRVVWHSSEAHARQSLFSFVKEFIPHVLKLSQKGWSASASQPQDVLTNHTKSIPVCGRLDSSSLSKHQRCDSRQTRGKAIILTAT